MYPLHACMSAELGGGEGGESCLGLAEAALLPGEVGGGFTHTHTPSQLSQELAVPRPPIPTFHPRFWVGCLASASSGLSSFLQAPQGTRPLSPRPM